MTKKHMPAYWQEAAAALSATDLVMAGIIRQYDGEMLARRGTPFFTLARAIVGQQISVKAADAVWKKLEAGLGGSILPESVLVLEDDGLRALGLSRQKVVYLKDLSRYFTQEADTIAHWVDMDDEALIKSLTSIRGIGRWTAEMFLIFHLLRPDVYPVDDLGLQKAVERHYFNGEKQKPAIIRQYGERWQPWRSVATWYLWRSLDPVPVEY